MKKLKIFFPVLLVFSLILVGASCGEKKEGAEERAEDKEKEALLEKELTGEQMKQVLLQTAADLGWSETNVTSAGSKGYQLKKVYVTGEDKTKHVVLAITEVSDSDMSLILPGSDRKTFIEDYCESVSGYKETRGGRESELIELSGFDACNTVEYMLVLGDLNDCWGHSDTMSVIGSYWVQVISTAMDEHGEICDAEDSVPIATILVNNLLEVLK